MPNADGSMTLAEEEAFRLLRQRWQALLDAVSAEFNPGAATAGMLLIAMQAFEAQHGSAALVETLEGAATAVLSKAPDEADLDPRH